MKHDAMGLVLYGNQVSSSLIEPVANSIKSSADHPDYLASYERYDWCADMPFIDTPWKKMV
jgi:hypothetical protein